MKKSVENKLGYFIDGRRASLLKIVESAGGETWKTHLETHGYVRKSTDRYLKSKLGEYLNASEIRSISGIKPSTLNKWRKGGILKSEKINGWWHYSVSSLVSAIKSDKT